MSGALTQPGSTINCHRTEIIHRATRQVISQEWQYLTNLDAKEESSSRGCFSWYTVIEAEEYTAGCVWFVPRRGIHPRDKQFFESKDVSSEQTWYPESLPKNRRKKSFLASLKLLCASNPQKSFWTQQENLRTDLPFDSKQLMLKFRHWHLFGFSRAGMKNSLGRAEENTATERTYTRTLYSSVWRIPGPKNISLWTPGEHPALGRHCCMQNKQRWGRRREKAMSPWSSPDQGSTL